MTKVDPSPLSVWLSCLVLVAVLMLGMLTTIKAVGHHIKHEIGQTCHRCEKP